MLKNVFGRSGALVIVLAAAASILFGVNSPANASALVYQADNVSIRVTGGEATALNRCINDAQDGVINTQINSCEQVATAGNLLQLEDVAIWVFRSCNCGIPLYSDSHIDIEVTGGIANAINECVNDSRDGVINTQINNCRQYATAGNIVMLSRVSVAVYQ